MPDDNVFYEVVFFIGERREVRAFMSLTDAQAAAAKITENCSLNTIEYIDAEHPEVEYITHRVNYENGSPVSSEVVNELNPVPAPSKKVGGIKSVSAVKKAILTPEEKAVADKIAADKKAAKAEEAATKKAAREETAKAKAEEKAAKKAAKAANKTPRSKYALSSIITVIVKENPKKIGSESRTRFDAYGTTTTVEAYKKAVGEKALADIQWDLDHKFITIDVDPNAPVVAEQPSTDAVDGASAQA